MDTKRDCKPQPAGHWSLQDAKARFSELVRSARSDGPQHVTTHGRDAVVVISTEEYQRPQSSRSGMALIEAMQASPHPKVSIAPPRMPMAVRDVSL